MTKTHAAFALKNDQRAARGNPELRHALFPAGGQDRSNKPCGGQGTDAVKMHLIRRDHWGRGRGEPSLIRVPHIPTRGNSSNVSGQLSPSPTVGAGLRGAKTQPAA